MRAIRRIPKLRPIGWATLSFLAMLSFAACATQKEPEPLIKAEGDRVSTIPWNKPQTWEGQGQFGAFQEQHH